MERSVALSAQDDVVIDTQASLCALLQVHPALARAPRLGDRGFSAPKVEHPLVFPVAEATRDPLRERGVTIEGEMGSGCTVVLDSQISAFDLRLSFRGFADCMVVLGTGAKVTGTISFAGSGGLVVLGGAGTMHDSHIGLTINPGCAAYFAPGFTSVGSHWLVEEDATGPCCLMVGDDAMISWDVWCRNSDSHGIIDIASMRIINPARDLILGAHIWIGQGVRIARGVAIGTGSIIGLGAVVAGDIPSRVAAAGVPARVVREGVTWSRGREPTEAQIRHTVAQL
jgi:acetyltransferase-like isoleucine patch superfamily enzyme